MSVRRSPPREDADENDTEMPAVHAPRVNGGQGTERTARAPESATGRTESYASEFRNVRLPTFWKNRPALWFVQLESEFTAFRIRSDELKYSAIIRHLDEETMVAVSDILEDPPESDKYTHLKQALIHRFADSQERQMRRLLLGIELGDKKPSALLREMRTLAGSNATDGLLRTLWVQRLPERMQELLTMLDEVSLAKLAECADKAWDRTSHSLAVTTSSPQDDAIARLTKQVGELSKRLDSWSTRGRSRNPFRMRSKSRDRSGHRRSSQQLRSTETGKCFYHSRFGNSARKCTPPCSERPASEITYTPGN